MPGSKNTEMKGGELKIRMEFQVHMQKNPDFDSYFVPILYVH